MADESSAGTATRVQPRMVLYVLGGCVIVLLLAYMILIRGAYVALFEDLAPGEAADVVAALEADEVPHRLHDGGRSIWVPARQVDAVRLSLLSRSAPINNLSGFELFDETNMGLTDFDQRVKYQRALQGELAKTILLLDGVTGVRVHLAIPEKSAFRPDASQPRAAVTTESTLQGDALGALTIGIQRLVAAAVPELTISDVVVLNESGEVISTDLAVSDMLRRYSVVERHYERSVIGALELVFESADFHVRVLATPAAAPLEPVSPVKLDSVEGEDDMQPDRRLSAETVSSQGVRDPSTEFEVSAAVQGEQSEDSQAAVEVAPGPEDGKVLDSETLSPGSDHDRDFDLKVVVVSAEPLADALRGHAESVIRDLVALGRNDQIVFRNRIPGPADGVSVDATDPIPVLTVDEPDRANSVALPFYLAVGSICACLLISAGALVVMGYTQRRPTEPKERLSWDERQALTRDLGLLLDRAGEAA